MGNKVMYILVNEDIKIGKGKLAGQVGHAVCVYMYNFLSTDTTTEEMEFIDDYMSFQKKIILSCPQSKLEELEKEGYIRIRDKGLTELEPNTLTCVNFGIYDKDVDEIPVWVKELKLYHK